MAKNKYSVETLRELNVSYDHEHGLTQKDVDMANSYVELIEQTRSEITPQIGDRLIYVTEDGDYYGNALIENLHHTIFHSTQCRGLAQSARDLAV